MSNDDSLQVDNLIQQAKAIQNKLKDILKDAGEMEVTASSGGGMVHVTANGLYQIVSVKLDRQIVNPDDIEMLTDLIIAATNQALADAQAMINEEMSKVSSGLALPDKY
jgi:DNA-binding YbaB/EbfC family protein